MCKSAGAPFSGKELELLANMPDVQHVLGPLKTVSLERVFSKASSSMVHRKTPSSGGKDVTCHANRSLNVEKAKMRSVRYVLAVAVLVGSLGLASQADARARNPIDLKTSPEKGFFEKSSKQSQVRSRSVSHQRGKSSWWAFPVLRGGR